MNDGDFDFLVSCLENVTALRRDNKRLQRIFKMDDLLSDPLQDVTSEIVKRILDDYSTEAMDYFVAALRDGNAALRHKDGRTTE
jgi:hypothetical protein